MEMVVVCLRLRLLERKTSIPPVY